MEARLTPRGSLEGELRERLLARLRDVGLTGYAAKAYLALIVEPGVSAGDICKATGIPDSKVYYALEDLVRRHIVIAQHGNPSLFRPVDAGQIAESLKREAQEAFDHEVRVIEELVKEITPLLASQEGAQEVELAYIVKGRRNILAHMIRTIESAENEILMMNSGKELLEGLLPALQKAQERGLKVRVAVYGDSGGVRKMGFTELKVSNCNCNLLIADSKLLMTVARQEEENAYAIITGDRNMISLSRSYYDNPACCSLIQIRSSARSRA